MSDAIAEFLQELSLEQLNTLHSWVQQRVKEKRNTHKICPALPPTNNLEALAESAGLDISALMRARKHY